MLPKRNNYEVNVFDFMKLFGISHYEPSRPSLHELTTESVLN